MKALVAFGTKYGSTVQVAEAIGSVLRESEHQADVLDLRIRTPMDVGDYDLVVAGSSIIKGTWTPEARRFLDSSREALSARRIALFVCCGDVMLDPDHLAEHRQRYLVRVAEEHGIREPCAMGLFGGVVDFSRYGYLLKPFLNGRRANLERRGLDLNRPYDLRDWQAIRNWAASLV